MIEASHRAGLRSTATVMFGHIEEPWELAEHMRVVRELQERTGGITEFVPLSFIPFQTLLGRTHGVEEISREENLKHTAVFRLALGRSIPSVQASWVKMGLEAATESLRWGVNDLGGTLMEESISRLAGSYHGTRLEPEELVAAAHRAGRPAAERTTLYEIRRRYPLSERSNWPWKPNGMWWGSEARASSRSSDASSTISIELAASASSATESSTPSSSSLVLRGGPRTPARPGRGRARTKNAVVRCSVSTFAIRSRKPDCPAGRAPRRSGRAARCSARS